MGNSKSSLVQSIIKFRVMLLMLLPVVLFFIIFSYLPMLGAVMAFKSYNFTQGIFGSPFIGFGNFKYLFASGDATTIIRNTFLYNIGFIIVDTFLQITCAIILAELTLRWFKKLTQGLMFLPYVMSWVVVGVISYNFFGYNHGSINSLLKSLQMNPVDIYGNPSIWPLIIIFFCAWKWLGYGTILYLASIRGIDQEIYQAAEIDGANIFQRILQITLPALKPTIIVLVLLSVGNIFRGDFQMFFQLVGYNSAVYSTTDVIDTYVNRALIQSNEIGMAASAGLLQSVLGFITIMAINTLIRKYEKEYALF